jgi:integrase
MAILAECPWCHKKQSTRNRMCSCGNGLVAAKRAKKVRYWVSYRLPGGKQRREPAGFSIEEARAAEGKRRAPATIDMEISIIKTMVTKAFDNDLVDGRTVKAFRRVKRKLRRGANARRRTITIAEYLKLVEVAAPHLKGILTVAYNTSMRTAEILGLRWSHIDREKWVIRLTADIPKEKKAKVIPINHYVKNILASLPQAIHHDAVFTYKNEPIGTLGGVKKSFITACEKAGILQGQDEPEGIIFYDIRRTVKTNMLSAGIDRVYRDMILGYSLRGMDLHYTSPSDDDLHGAMAKYTEWLDSQLDLQSVDHNVD